MKIAPIILLLLSSCASIRPVRTLEIRGVLVHIADMDTIQAVYRATGGTAHKVAGFTTHGRPQEIWCRYGVGDLPDFEVFGHEWWHIVEGDFHYTGFSGRIICEASIPDGE